MNRFIRGASGRFRGDAGPSGPRAPDCRNGDYAGPSGRPTAYQAISISVHSTSSTTV
jgi:hypothetical protein